MGRRVRCGPSISRVRAGTIVIPEHFLLDSQPVIVVIIDVPVLGVFWNSTPKCPLPLLWCCPYGGSRIMSITKTIPLHRSVPIQEEDTKPFHFTAACPFRRRILTHGEEEDIF